MRKNTRPTRPRTFDQDIRLAGGHGAPAAIQDPEALLRRAVLANLLWENQSYQAGDDVAQEIRRLVPLVEPDAVAQIAVEARTVQHLRHVPLFLLREAVRYPTHRHVVADALEAVVLRADELAEFPALYWDDEPDRPLAAQVKRGLARAFPRFDAYQLAKYDRANQAVRLRDVLFLVHPRPRDQVQQATWNALTTGTLLPPDTWEVALSAARTPDERRAVWERLVMTGKLGGLALLRNLRNMVEANVPDVVIRHGLLNLHPGRLLPLNFFAAARAVPRYTGEIEDAMLRCMATYPPLPGDTVIIVDVSGSMHTQMSDRSTMNRLDAAAALIVMAREMCERVTVWATAGNDMAYTHKTVEVPPYRGFALAEQVRRMADALGGGGIFTRQALDHVRTQLGGRARDTARTLVFTDSQDCDFNNRRPPAPFSRRNYLIDVAAHTRGIAYDNVWTAEITGWSESFLAYIAELERLDRTMWLNRLGGRGDTC